MSGVVAFDVNETLLDVLPLAEAIEELSGGAVSGGEWFARLLHRSLVANELDAYRPFGELGREALAWLLDRAGLDVSPDRIAPVVGMISSLPPHPDVAPALAELHDSGVRMVALTNGSQVAAAAQMEHAGLDGYLDAVLSVESLRRFKPDRAVYSFAASACGVTMSDLVMVAAHDWDIAGAQRAGAVGCFVARQPWGIQGVEPDVTIADLGGLAGALEDRWTS